MCQGETKYRKFAMNTPFVSIRKQRLVVIGVIQHLSQDDMFRPRRIDIRSLLHEIRCSPTIIDKDIGHTTDPDRDKWIVVGLAPFLDFLPRFALREV
jgi:hypothetical protein